MILAMTMLAEIATAKKKKSEIFTITFKTSVRAIEVELEVSLS